MKCVKLCLIIILLLFPAQGGYCFFQEGIDYEPAIQEMLVQRKVIEERFVEYQKQKELEKEKTKERISQTESKLEQIKSAQNKKIVNIQPKILSETEKQEKAAAAGQSAKILQFLLLIAGLIGCLYWIYKINQTKTEED